MNELSIDEFKRLDLRVASVLDAEEIPGADRLWRLTIDTGKEKKEIVAGLKPFYSKESLLGKKIIVVDNLQPAVIRGIESRGMLLAAKADAGRLALIVPDGDLPAGSVVG